MTDVGTTGSSPFDKVLARIRALRSKTIDNGCTEGEALAAAAKVAELLARFDLSLTDIELQDAPCDRRVYETHFRKRIPLDECIGAIARFCDCKVWREKNAAGEACYVYFGLRSDVETAHYLTELIDSAVRSELGRYKASPDYRLVRHRDRHLANASFALGMAASIADRLLAMKAARDETSCGNTGRAIVVLKTAVVDRELAKLDLKFATVQVSRGRLVAPMAYDAGGAAAEAVPLSRDLRRP